MLRMNKSKGFLLIDSLITVFVMSILCTLCYSMYNAGINYEEGYRKYQEESNDRLEEIYVHMYDCQGCEIIDESD